MWKKLISLKFWIPVILLCSGAGFTYEMIKNKPSARKRHNFKSGKLVEVIVASISNPKIEIRTHGRVFPAKRIVLSARISGEVIWISPKLKEGSFFKKDQHLLSIGIRQSQSRLKAPFNGVVQSKHVDLGQYVNTGTKLASLIGSNLVEVKIDLPMGKMNWLPLFTKEGSSVFIGKEGHYKIPAKISLAGISSNAVWPAVINRHLLELTPRGMMVQLIAEVKDPFVLSKKKLLKVKELTKNQSIRVKKNVVSNSEIRVSKSFSKMPLFVGAFVDVKIAGRQLENVIQIPAKALRDRDTVWIALGNELIIRNVNIAYIDLDNVYLSGGIKPGEKIIVSPLKGAANGLKIRISGEKKGFKDKSLSKKRKVKNAAASWGKKKTKITKSILKGN